MSATVAMDQPQMPFGQPTNMGMQAPALGAMNLQMAPMALGQPQQLGMGIQGLQMPNLGGVDPMMQMPPAQMQAMQMPKLQAPTLNTAGFQLNQGIPAGMEVSAGGSADMQQFGGVLQQPMQQQPMFGGQTLGLPPLQTQMPNVMSTQSFVFNPLNTMMNPAGGQQNWCFYPETDKIAENQIAEFDYLPDTLPLLMPLDEKKAEVEVAAAASGSSAGGLTATAPVPPKTRDAKLGSKKKKNKQQGICACFN